MSDSNQTPVRKVKILKESVARKIAAGEVIDRPLSVLRELLDNALDAGSTSVEIRLESGGLKSLLVVDDGFGMSVADLELCWLPHATSKIETEEDLNHIFSLGFRGEALASIAACSRLSITSAVDDTGLAQQLVIENSETPRLRKTSGKRGTRVLVEDLFYNIPARRNFMKSPATETTLCRRAMEDKALAFPHVAFQLWVDEKLKAQYPRETLKERVLRIAEDSWKNTSIVEFQQTMEGFALHVFALKPHFHRNDRKDIHIFANNRPLQEFSLVQAVCYAFEGYLPGGAYPQAYVFLQVDPALVDFNIHPAKKEARFRNLSLIHHALSVGLREVLTQERLHLPLLNTAMTVPQSEFPIELRDSSSDSRYLVQDQPQRFSFAQTYQTLVEQKEAVNDASKVPIDPTDDFRYLGQILGVFLLVERQGTLYLIDQHAAHERILYEKFQAKRDQSQSLLIPLVVQVEEETSEILGRDLKKLEALGFAIKRVSAQTFEVWKLPQSAVHLEHEIVRFLRDYKKPAQDLEKALYANLACRSAVMDGDVLDSSAARELVRQTFTLNDARCPHGRPIWFSLTREELFEKVGRVI